MMGAKETGMDRLMHTLRAPSRWATRRHRRALALNALRQAKTTYGPKAHLTVWNDKIRGGVGVISLERGSVQVYVEEGGYYVQWFGKNQHPIPYDEVRTADDTMLEAAVRKWTAQWYVDKRRPSAGPHHVEV